VDGNWRWVNYAAPRIKIGDGCVRRAAEIGKSIRVRNDGIFYVVALIFC